LFGALTTLVVDVQHADHPDLRGYVRGHHTAVLLDEVSSPQFIVANKKLLQAHVDGAILGQSATQMYTYEVFLWKVPIMLTTNNFHLEDMAEHDRDWIHQNCVCMHVAEPVWETEDASGAAASAFVPPPVASSVAAPAGKRRALAR